jgi:2-polyprenyl-6-methoxyphenol hydroxylase-like FAD-dependent oxidoreductase
LLERFQCYHEPIPGLIEHTDSLLRMNVYDIQSLPTWHKGGRILLIGDAAHAVSPNSGQGASLALEDAMCLAKLMRDCAGDVEHAFVQFERERKPRVEKIVAEGRRRASDKEIVSPIQSKIRNWMMQLFFRLAKPNSDQWILGYKIGWES